MATRKSKENEARGIEESLSRLAEIVEKLESEETKLDDALQLYREGHELAKVCRMQLTEAEMVVSALTDGNDTAGEIEG